MTIPDSKSEIYKSLRPITGLLLKGSVISIDPSIGSTSSQPAFAYYRQGELIEVGKADIDPSLDTYIRLQDLAEWVKQLYKSYRPDILVYEEIPDQRYMPMFGGRPQATGHNVKAHASLLKAVGAILSVRGPDHFLGMRPQVWKARVDESYIKGDIEDAKWIGLVAINIAKEMEADDGGFNTGTRSRSRTTRKNTSR